MSDTEPIITIAGSPFDDTAADVILQSSDNIHFYFHKLLLSLASPIFADMFTLPQPSGKCDNPRHVVSVSEDSETLRRLLQWYDPRCTPQWESVEDVLVILEAADKYCMDKAMKLVGNILLHSTSFVEREPMKVFALAVRYRLGDVAQMAAKCTLRFTWEEQIECTTPELEHIPGTILQQLGVYQLSCKRAAQQVATDLTWLVNLQSSNLDAVCWQRSRHGCPTKRKFDKDWRKWFLDYMEFIRAKVYNRPSGTTIVPEFIDPEVNNIDVGCPTCKEVAGTELLKINRILIEEIDKIISEIPFGLIY
ncbi:hypothetical protein B0H10DRAFT_2188372 [Mycena sp. CBHHK59/15]|nr:hypothetical protein B0H10DRAFT_2188372 [Mycena sp. CBHHK59/15]